MVLPSQLPLTKLFAAMCQWLALVTTDEARQYHDTPESKQIQTEGGA